MASNRKLGLTNDSKQNEAILKRRVKELEEEVSGLKKKLDELRKAKNTTITKREREVLEVGVPFGRRDSKPVVSGEKSSDSRDKEIDELRKKFAAEMDQLRKDYETDKGCDHDNEIEALRVSIFDLQAENAALMVENSDLKERVTSLVTDLSVKEAKWCEMEEKLKLEIQKSWGDKYKKWMAETEHKIQELQQTNDLLRGYLKKKSNGADKDPYPGI